MKAYILKARSTLGMSWLCPVLVCEQDNVASQKDSVLPSKVAMKKLGRAKKNLKQKTVDLFPDIPTANGPKHTHTLQLKTSTKSDSFHLKKYSPLKENTFTKEMGSIKRNGFY